jgi:cysteine desulfurase
MGALFIRRGTKMQPLLQGGTQERSRRAGTENVAGVVGLARATELILQDQEGAAKRLRDLRDQLECGLMAALSGVERNGHPTERLPQTTNLAFAAVEAESLILALDLEGIGASSGAACSSGSLELSHVLTAMGLPPKRVASSVRFSLGRTTTPEEIASVLEIVPPIVERMRRIEAGHPAGAGASA